MTDPIELLRDANPVPECERPPIETLWARLDEDSSQPSHPRATAWSGSSRRGGRGGGHWSRSVATLALVLIVVVVGVGALVLLAGRTQQPPATSPPGSASRSQRQALVDILGVLRRPQAKTDLNPRVLRGLNQGMPIGSPIRSLVRMATVTPWGTKVYLVPVNKPTDKQIDSYVARLTNPESERMSIAHRLKAQFKHRRTFRGLDVLVGGGQSCCSTAAQIKAGDAWTSSGSSDPPTGTLVIVVPDGVAEVKVVFSRSVAHENPKTITAAVNNNVVAMRTPEGVENLQAERMTWYGIAGNIIRRPQTAGHTPKATPKSDFERP